MTEGMRFGLFSGAQDRPGDFVTEAAHDYHAFVDYVVRAERLGYRSVWLFEHHFTGFGQMSQSLNVLSYLAAKTSTMRLGTAVVVVPWHNPVLLAEQVGTVDVLSKGRYDFGVGRGYRHNEFLGFAVDPDEAGAMYAEAMAIILRAWSEPGRWSYKSDRWEFNDIVVEPRPVQKPHPPLWQGAGSADSIRRAAREGFNLLLDQMSSFEVIGERVALYREEVESLGRTFDPYSIGVTRGLMAANTDKERRRAYDLRGRFITDVQVLTDKPELQVKAFNPVGNRTDPVAISDQGAIIGSTDEMIERTRILYDMGVRNVLFHDLTGSVEALQQFAEEVMPHFTGEGGSGRDAAE